MTVVPRAMTMLLTSAPVHCSLPKKSWYQRSDHPVIGKRIIAASLNDMVRLMTIGMAI